MVKRDPAPPVINNPPQAPDPVSEELFINGRKVSSRIYDKPNQIFTDNIYLDPLEENIVNTSLTAFNDLLPLIEQQVPLSEEDRVNFRDQIYNPAARQIETQFNKTLGESIGAGTASGTTNSIGFENFRTQRLEKNRDELLSDAFNRADLQSYDLPNLKLSPIINALSVFDSSINSPTSRGFSALSPVMAGSQSGSNYFLNSFSAEQAALANQQRLSLQQPRSGGGGFSTGRVVSSLLNFI